MNPKGHLEDCGWVDEPEDEDDRDYSDRYEPEYDGPMPECGEDWREE